MAEETEEKRKTGRLGAAPIALVTALIALASGGIGLVFDLAPGLRPDPRTSRGAEMKVVAFDPDVRLGDALRRVNLDEDDLREARSEHIAAVEKESQGALSAVDRRDYFGLTGNVFYVQTEVEGFKRDRVRLFWSLYRVKARRRDPNRDYQDQQAIAVRLAAPTDRAVTQVWVQPPYARGEHFVRFELRDKEGATLAVADSDPIPGIH